jgi:MoaA/NifB/PqqE/SkfB family radical SAM enzyme
MMDLVLKEYFITISKLFFSKYVTPKKLLNAIAVYLQYLLKTERIIGYPIKIYVDPASVCNLKCPLCPTGNGDKSRSKGFMKFEAFKKIIDEVKDYVIQVDLYNWGEPLLNKEIFKMVEYAHKLGIRTRISTNLTILSESAVENMINSGLDELIASIDGASEETYQKYRVGGSFEKVIENLKLILRN